MKKHFLIALALLSALCCGLPLAQAQNSGVETDKYTAGFRKAMKQLDSSWVDMAKMRETANQFERLANFKKDDWLPRYYHALCLIQQSWSAADAATRAPLLKGAEASVKSADALSPNNSEIVALEGYMYYAMILIDPMSNGPIYAPKGSATLQKAMQLDANNPRPSYMIGQNIYFTPDQWGGGMENARPYLEKAQKQYAAFVPASEFHPNWGRVPCDMILAGKMPRE